MSTNQGSINRLLQCVVSLVNKSHSDKPDFSKRSGLPTPKSTDFFSKHALRACFKIQGVKMTPHLICPLPVSQCVVHSWHTYKQFLQCSHSDFFRLLSAILGQSSFPGYSFGVLYWAHDQSTRVTCSRARSSTRNSWCMFALSPSPRGDECAQPSVFLGIIFNTVLIREKWG